MSADVAGAPVAGSAKDDGRARRSLPARIILGGLLAFAVVVLFGLGVWQIERLGEKLALIDRVDHRVHAEPVAPPGPAEWPEVNAASSEYLHVRISGHFLNDRETLTQAVTEAGPGFWVMTPLVTDAGFTVLVNRGFVPADTRDPTTRAEGEPAGDVTVVGLLRITEPKGGFLRRNDPAANRWYSRDVSQIATARGLTDAAPYFIDADATPNPGGLPIGGLTVIHFPNNHLVYALTWFALAIGIIAGVIYVRCSKHSRGSSR